MKFKNKFPNKEIGLTVSDGLNEEFVQLVTMRDVVRFALTPEAKAAGLPLPSRAHESDAGFDLWAFRIELANVHELSSTIANRAAGAIGSEVKVYDPKQAVYAIDTGVRVTIPEGWCGIIKERSSWAKAGLQISGGVIDSSYRGSLIVICRGFERRVSIDEALYPRFAQLLIVPVWSGAVEYVDDLDETERGADGFGSTGQG